MKNSTENPKSAEEFGNVSQDMALTDQGDEAAFFSESTAGKNESEAVTMTELEDAEVLDALAQVEETREVEPLVIPGCTKNLEAINEIKSDLSQVFNGVNCITEATSKIAREINEMHKLYHNEFSKRLLSMQEEIENYREIEKGRTFDGILGEIAKLYSDNITVLNEITDVKINKGLRYMFLDILQLLESYGVAKQESKVGDKRNTKYCQVIECIQTDNSELHDTVTRSLNTGFYVENRSLVKEMVHVYLYTKKINDKSVNE